MSESSHEMIAHVLRSRFGKTAPREEHPGWNWREPRSVKIPCRQCGEHTDVWCVYADAGMMQFCPEFYHLCLACGHIDHESGHGGWPGWEDKDYDRCPFCEGRRDRRCPPHEWTSHWVQTEEILGAEDGVHFLTEPAKMCIHCGKVEEA